MPYRGKCPQSVAYHDHFDDMAPEWADFIELKIAIVETEKFDKGAASVGNALKKSGFCTQ